MIAILQLDEKNPALIALRTAEGKLNQLIEAQVAKQSELEHGRARYVESRRRASPYDDIEVGEILTGGSQPSRPTPETFAELERALAVLGAAIDHQKQMVDVARGKYSLAVCELNRANYIAIEKRLATALRELAEANQAENDFFRGLEELGCRGVPLRSMRVDFIGFPDDKNSFANAHRREMLEFAPEAL